MNNMKFVVIKNTRNKNNWFNVNAFSNKLLDSKITIMKRNNSTDCFFNNNTKSRKSFNLFPFEKKKINSGNTIYQYNIKYEKYPPSKYKYFVRNNLLAKTFISKLHQKTNKNFFLHHSNNLKLNYFLYDNNDFNDRFQKKKVNSMKNITIRNYSSKKKINQQGKKFYSGENFIKKLKNNNFKNIKRDNTIKFVKQKILENDFSKSIKIMIEKYNRINILESKKIINCQFEDSKNNNSEYDLSSFFLNKSKKQIKNKGTQTNSYDFS